MNRALRVSQLRNIKPYAYEAIILIKPAPKDELAAIVRRTAYAIFKRGGFLRDMKYMGLQKTPNRISKNALPHWEANYFYFNLHVPKALIPDLYNEYERDIDIIKHTFNKTDQPDIDYENCTFEEEMKAVPYRPQVLRLIEATNEYRRRQTKRRVKLNINTDFFPFQK